MFELTDLQKIGLGLVGFGSCFLVLGMFLFLDRVLLGLGNILFLAGLCEGLEIFMKEVNLTNCSLN